VLPLTVDHVKTAMQRKTKQAFLEANLKAFDLGFAAAQQA
jgi:indolepyruvate ferredoxin oxidoreductase beta subunit